MGQMPLVTFICQRLPVGFLQNFTTWMGGIGV